MWNVGNFHCLRRCEVKSPKIRMARAFENLKSALGPECIIPRTNIY